MPGKDMVTMSQQELRRLWVIRKAIDKVITQKEAAESIRYSERQVRRLVARVRQDGDKGLIHRLRGKASNRAVPAEVRAEVIAKFKGDYVDFGPTLACEKLVEREGISISDETLRIWLQDEGIPYKRRKRRRHRQWRKRKECFGQMVQMDGSEHDWFEGRRGKCAFMGYIDDATGRVFGRFYEYEGTVSAMDSFKRYIDRHGVPQSIYLDKHSTYKPTKRLSIEDELAGREHAPSQFGRALEELGVEMVYANSPQAKGRIERLFKTFQDRLIKEMRLNGISTIEDGNRFLEGYLPVYSQRFGVAAEEPVDLHRPVSQGLDLYGVLCVKQARVLRKDFTVSYKTKLYQIEDNIQGGKVMVEERLDNTLIISRRGKPLSFRRITADELKPDGKTRRPVKNHPGKGMPGEEHPWKKLRTVGRKEQRIADYQELSLLST